MTSYRQLGVTTDDHGYPVNQTTRYLQSVSAQKGIEVGVLVNYLILDAVKAGASDIHIEPWESTLVVRLRLLGVLTELVHLPLDLMEKISGRLKVMANLISYQTDLPQEGHAPASPDIGGVELRISVFPTVRGEKIVVRIFDPSNRSFDLGSLGFEEETLRTLVGLLARPSGLLLLTGPTGSGKTTAIYAALYHLVQRSGPTISISTVEDPVEFNLPMVSQAQVNPVKEFTYPVALRSLMRQDPQVIMIGEIRDPETAAIAVQAGLTGHLVISTIHSGSTAGVFARLINMDIEPFLLSSSIIGIVGLRLIRKNCPYCAQPYQIEPSFMRLLSPEMIETATFRRGVGCKECMETGFLGRTALTEMLVVDEVLRDSILQKLPTRSLQQVAIQQGMQTLWQLGLRRVIHGQTALEEILRVVAVDQF
ncbi:MAG: type II/IV secretion system protein [Chloroflexi bacterium]|nr:type II/IV secretion system protein [Chloroflexota bacterium]